MMDALQAQAEYEEQKIHYWHIDYFRSLKFKRHQAEILELAHVQPHDAEDLLKHGCTHEQAIEILT